MPWVPSRSGRQGEAGNTVARAWAGVSSSRWLFAILGIVSLAAPWVERSILREVPVRGSMSREPFSWCLGLDLFQAADPSLSHASWTLIFGLVWVATSSLLRAVRAEWPETLVFESTGVCAIWAARLAVDIAALYLWGSGLMTLPFCRPLHPAFYAHLATFCACVFLTLAWTPFELWRALARLAAARAPCLSFAGARC